MPPCRIEQPDRARQRELARDRRSIPGLGGREGAGMDRRHRRRVGRAGDDHAGGRRAPGGRGRGGVAGSAT